MLKINPCKLCIKISIPVFLSIILIEGMILIPSYLNYERDELLRINKSAHTAFTVAFNIDNDFNYTAEHLINNSSILGFILIKDNVIVKKYGDIPNINPSNKRINHGQHYDVKWQSMISGIDKIVVRLDTDMLDRMLILFVIRIIGLVAVIACFVTIALMMVLEVTLLGKLKLLRDKLLLAADDPQNPSKYKINNYPNDEYGEVSHSIDILLSHIDEGLKSLSKLNDSLEETVLQRTTTIIETNRKLENEIKERKRYEEELIQRANYDIVTDLPNKNLFFSKTSKILRDIKTTSKIVGTLLIELNEFQEINDAYGHHIGDLLLTQVGKNLKHNYQQINTVARIGTNQIGILTNPLVDIDEIDVLINQILEFFAKPFDISKQKITTTINIGAAIIPDNGTEPKSIIRNADLALKRSKDSQHNSYQFYESDMNRKIQQRHNTLVDLHYALENEEFFLLYQPQICLKTGKIIGMEALIRWQHPEKGIISPFDFIPLAEESGLIVPIGEWVIQEACLQAKEWHNDGHTNLRVAVNLSAVQFNQKNLIHVIQQALNNSQLPSANLEVEITESSLISDIEYAINTMHEINNIGVLIAVDDFGTGYSSLSYLTRFPVQKLKVDQSFIRGLCIDTKPSDNIADAIVFLGHSLNLTVIAEGVETQYQEQYLKNLKCDEAQGYLYSKPLTADDFAKFLKEFPAKN